MNKEQFLLALRQGLLGLSEEDIQNSLDYYAEMIDDRVEDGKTEEDAVAELGSVEEIIEQILSEMTQSKPNFAQTAMNETKKLWHKVSEKATSKKAGDILQIILLILGFPLWFPLLLSVAIVFLAIYIVLWSLVLSLIIVAFSFGVSALACLGGVLICALSGNGIAMVLCLGVMFLLIGFTIFLFLAGTWSVRGACWVGRMFFVGIKRLFVKRGENHA